jgi:hypothetical protein
MAQCIYCGTNTSLYVNGVPLCLQCDKDLQLGRKPPDRETNPQPPKAGTQA